MKPLIVANWKMNTSLADALLITNLVKNNAVDLNADIVLCPPYIWLAPMAEILEKSSKNIHLGAQNIWFTDHGAVTGEISPLMLKELARYVIVGHSERRHFFKESDELIVDKIKAAIRHDLTPIVCVGELRKMHESSSNWRRGRGRPTKIDIRADIIVQVETIIKELTEAEIEKVIFCYEPVWAISTSGEGPATGAYATQVVQRIREVLAEKYNRNLAQSIKILYGGSVDEDNVKEYIYQPEIDGVLVGSASLKAKEFVKICREASGLE